jgi:hypothetical protein
MCKTGLENAASVRQFSEKDKNYFAYQARHRQQMSIYGELELLSLENSRLYVIIQSITASTPTLKGSQKTVQICS